MTHSKYAFVGHNASRTGAPVVLLHLLRWLRETRPDISFDVFLIEGGPLESEYREIAQTSIIRQPRSIAERAYDKLRRTLDPKAEIGLRGVRTLTGEYDAVIGNTIVSLPVLKHFSERNVRTICWMHEMEYVIRSFYSESRFRSLMTFVDHLLLPSEAVGRVVRNLLVDTPYTIVPELQPPIAKTDPVDPVAARRSLEIPPDSFVVLGCGTVEWRKGVDIFLDVAAEMTKEYEDIHFIWVGGRGFDEAYVSETVCRIDASDPQIRSYGHAADLSPYFAASNVFALTSREDPFPLVCLLAADRSVPTVCFEGVGGIPDFAGSDAGTAVPAFDTAAFAAAIRRLYNDREDLKRKGELAREKFRGPYSLDTSARKILDLIENGQSRTSSDLLPLA